MEKSADKFTGVIVPMVSPSTADGMIDTGSSARIIRHLQDNGAVPFIMGTNGEGTSISLAQRERLVSTLIKNNKKDDPVIAGVLGLAFEDTVTVSNSYLKEGVDAVVITLPNYFELTDRQKYEYFDHLSGKIHGDIILYNIPKTVRMSLPLDIVEKLSHEKNIIGIKDSENDPARLVESLKRWHDRKDFFHFTGVNSLMYQGLLLGSKGIVPGSGNLCPELYSAMFRLVSEGRRDEAKKMFTRTENLCRLYQEGYTLGESIAALKTLMASLGLCLPVVFPPLTEIDEETSAEIISNFQKEFCYEK